MKDKPHKLCTCTACQAGGNKAIFAADAVADLAAARHEIELTAQAIAETTRIKQVAESETAHA